MISLGAGPVGRHVEPSFDVALSWLLFHPDVAHLWGFCLEREEHLAMKMSLSHAPLGQCQLDRGACLSDITASLLSVTI